MSSQKVDGVHRPIIKTKEVVAYFTKKWVDAGTYGRYLRNGKMHDGQKFFSESQEGAETNLEKHYIQKRAYYNKRLDKCEWILAACP